jgi:hypothetical protein
LPHKKGQGKQTHWNHTRQEGTGQGQQVAEEERKRERERERERSPAGEPKDTESN